VEAGWVQSDEAVVHYAAMIEQWTEVNNERKKKMSFYFSLSNKKNNSNNIREHCICMIP